jgi:membrane associated rhomboid family serine protease
VTEELSRAVVGLGQRLKWVLGFVAVLWAVEAMDWVLLGSLDGFGIRPRETFGLVGIALAPFLHGSFAHLMANTTALIPLGLLVTARRKTDLVLVSIPVVLLGGAAVWLLGRAGSVHIGASGLVFGWFGYLLALGWYERSPRAVVVALFVGLLYGGMIFGVLPGQPGISWESHLFGFFAGGFAARTLSRRRR